MLVNLRGDFLEETILEEVELGERLLPVARLGLYVRHIVPTQTTEALADERFVLAPRPFRELHDIVRVSVVDTHSVGVHHLEGVVLVEEVAMREIGFPLHIHRMLLPALHELDSTLRQAKVVSIVEDSRQMRKLATSVYRAVVVVALKKNHFAILSKKFLPLVEELVACLERTCHVADDGGFVAYIPAGQFVEVEEVAHLNEAHEWVIRSLNCLDLAFDCLESPNVLVRNLQVRKNQPTFVLFRFHFVNPP